MVLKIDTIKQNIFLVPGKLFEDYFVRLEKYEASKQSEINNEGLCCDCCESIR